MKVFLNPQYAIRNEANCSYLVKIERSEFRISNKEYETIAPVTPIPPIFGYIIDRINGIGLYEAITTIHKKLEIPKETLNNFISKIIENECFLKLKLKSSVIILPPYIFTENNSNAKIVTFPDFQPWHSFIQKRPSFPLFINLMITSKCKTDCIYCYANRSRKDDLAVETILRTIDQAHNEGVLYMNISGGDIFATKGWRKVLEQLYKNNFHPFISTKIPLKEDDVKFLKEIGVEKIQFSIDSFLPKETKLIVKRGKKYVEDVQSTFTLLQKYKIHLGVRSVLTKYNSSVESVRNTLKILEKYSESIDYWDLTPAFYSEFRGDYINYQPTDDALREIQSFILGIKSPIFINEKNLENKLNSNNIIYKDVYDFTCKNKECIANTYSMFIMSNGKSTLCELLYYNENFYTGDINECSLRKIWNSEKSLKLYSPKQKDVININDNPCYNCALFKKCKSVNGKKICYVDIIKAYGTQRSDFPDPRCPKAPLHNPELLLY